MRSTIKYIHEDRLVVEVEVSLIETDSEWFTYYSIEDARKLERTQGV